MYGVHSAHILCDLLPKCKFHIEIENAVKVRLRIFHLILKQMFPHKIHRHELKRNCFGKDCWLSWVKTHCADVCSIQLEELFNRLDIHQIFQRSQILFDITETDVKPMSVDTRRLLQTWLLLPTNRSEIFNYTIFWKKLIRLSYIIVFADVFAKY